MAGISADLLRDWAELLTDAAEIIKPPWVTAAHDQMTAQARACPGGGDVNLDEVHRGDRRGDIAARRRRDRRCGRVTF
jgi:hypothetical protein